MQGVEITSHCRRTRPSEEFGICEDLWTFKPPARRVDILTSEFNVRRLYRTSPTPTYYVLDVWRIIGESCWWASVQTVLGACKCLFRCRLCWFRCDICLVVWLHNGCLLSCGRSSSHSPRPGARYYSIRLHSENIPRLPMRTPRQAAELVWR